MTGASVLHGRGSARASDKGGEAATELLTLSSHYLALPNPPASGIRVLGFQAGMIKSDTEEYFIEPLERGKQMEEAKGRIHVVYKRSALEQAPRDVSEDSYYRDLLIFILCEWVMLPYLLKLTDALSIVAIIQIITLIFENNANTKPIGYLKVNAFTCFYSWLIAHQYRAGPGDLLIIYLIVLGFGQAWSCVGLVQYDFMYV
ncbi:hypothetical protein STEG23_014080 [Scotinomys teguina]